MKIYKLIEHILQETSKRSWESVNKSKLPDSCFFWPEKRKLPYREGTGGIDPDTGKYRQAGKINENGVKAAYGATKGARTGKPMSIPSEVRQRIVNVYKRLFGHEPGEEE